MSDLESFRIGQKGSSLLFRKVEDGICDLAGRLRARSLIIRSYFREHDLVLARIESNSAFGNKAQYFLRTVEVRVFWFAMSIRSPWAFGHYESISSRKSQLCARMPLMQKQVVVIAGPAGSGKDSIVQGVLKKCSNATLMVTATTRTPRPSEVDGVNYHFLTNEKFLEEQKAGNILEYYHREETDTYYGTYKPDIDARIKSGKVVFAVIQIVGAKYLKEHYDATTIFIMPPSLGVLERRVRGRAPMTDLEWQERLAHTQREITEDAPFYDYRIQNDDGKLDQAIDEVIEILRKEGYTLGA